MTARGAHMKRKRPILSIVCAFCALGMFASARGQTSIEKSHVLRPATVADSIGMTQLTFPDNDPAAPATFSPDGKLFIILTHRGNLENNTNDSSLLLFQSADVFLSPRPEVLLTWTSSSNDPSISNVRWVADNKTVLFLGEKSGQKRQIYSLDVQSRKLAQLTQHPTDIIAFDATADLRAVAYLARPQITSMSDENSGTHDLVISDQNLLDLLIGHRSDTWWESPLELFLQWRDKRSTRIAFKNREMPVPQAGVSLSPDGRFAVVLSNTRRYVSPEVWKEYKTPFGYNQIEFLEYRLIDTHEGSVRSLVDAPTFFLSGLAWLADGKSIVLGATYLPLNTQDKSERELRMSTEWAVEVDVTTGDFTKIAKGSYRLVRCDLSTRTLFLEAQTATVLDTDKHADQVIAWRKSGSVWKRIDPHANGASSRGFGVQEEQDINTPPRLFVVDQKSGTESLMLDLNPQFRGIRFGHVEEITWKGTDGTETKGGLYLPPDYVPGRAYPIVIQTHGWNPTEFSIDGWTTSGYAAQALAGKGIVVAQVPMAKDLSTTLEGPVNMAMFEGLIDDLDKRGLIDRTRVGLMGFSRTGYAVRYTLAFSKYPVAAAVLADAMDGGYWTYIFDNRRNLYEEQNGAAPFGKGLQNWLKNAPSFNLDKTHTPVRQLAFGPRGLAYQWEPFIGLKRLGRPVELIWLPDAQHEPVKPLERMTVQQGDVDWFCFWLKGEQDPDASKAQQYARWREMRKLQNESLQAVDHNPY